MGLKARINHLPSKLSVGEQRQTIIMVTHNPELGATADRIIHFGDGKVEE